MNLLNFIATYPDEESCRTKFKEYRDQQGVILSQMRAQRAVLETR
jgi:hypothetical protein